MINSSARKRPRDQSRLKWPPKAAKVKRVAGVVVDQHVPCRQCNNLMHVADDLTFRCKQCGWEVAAEDAIKVLESPATSWSAAVSGQRN